MNLRNISLVTLLSLAACAQGGVTLSQLNVSSSYNPGEFAYGAADRDLRVVIVGNPFGGDSQAFGTAVTDAMQGQHFGQHTNFTTTPGPEARLAYRVVLVFGPPAGMNAARQCREEALAVQTVRTNDQIELSGAFCRGDNPMTRIRGRVSGAANAQDPAFQALVCQVTNGLFPPDRERDRNGRGCRPWMNC